MANKEKNEQVTPATTPEQDAIIAANKDKAKKKAQARKEARARIMTFLKENANQLGSLKADIESFIGKDGGTKRTVTKSLNTELRDALLAAGENGLSEMEIFKKFRIGRPEMATKIRILVLTPNTEDRVWVKFNEATESYSVVGLGTEPPAGWDGYLPTTKVAL